jgi:hypothetical protein
LAHEGVSFQQIADEIRFAIACDLLARKIHGGLAGVAQVPEMT